MESLAGLARQLKSVSSLGHLVKTLKTLSAVNMRMFDRAAEAMEAYLTNIESGLQVVLRTLPDHHLDLPAEGPPRLVMFGSDHGLCGAFHQQLLHFVGKLESVPSIICLGTRLADAAQDVELKVDTVLSAPTSTAALAEVAGELLRLLQPMTGRVSLVYQRSHHGQHHPHQETLWPIETAWLNELRKRPWLTPGQPGGLPLCWDDPVAAFGWLLEEHIQVACQRALAHSLASENQARLATMQSAEKNLDEMRTSLRDRLQSHRQNAVTEELLDVISGFEMLKDLSA